MKSISQYIIRNIFRAVLRRKITMFIQNTFVCFVGKTLFFDQSTNIFCYDSKIKKCSKRTNLMLINFNLVYKLCKIKMNDKLFSSNYD